jgi:hypothetical protein
MLRIAEKGLPMETRRFLLSTLLILTLSACATTGGNRAEDQKSNEIIFGVGTNVVREPVPLVQDLGKRVFRPGETIGVMVLVRGYVGQKIRLDLIRMDDHFTRTIISEIVPVSSNPGGAFLWWHNEKIWSVKGDHPEVWVAELQIGSTVKRHEFVVSPFVSP